MKKLVLSVAMLALGATAMAQGGYVAFNVGYGLGFPNEQLGTTGTVDASGNETEANIFGTLGQGINLNLTPGYMINSNFGMELGIGYFLGSEVTVDEFTAPTYSEMSTGKSSQIRISPSLVVSSGDDAAVNVYGKAGLVLPVGGSTEGTYTRTGDGSALNPDVVSMSETKGAFSLGFSGAIGAKYSLSDNLSLFGELNGVFLRIKQGTSTILSSSTNGVEADFSGTPTSFLETVYVDELNSSSNNAGTNPTGYDPNQADEQLAGKTNFNGTFINIGVAYSF